MHLKQHLTDTSTDQEDRGGEMFFTIDHDAAARHGISSRDIDNALYNAFGQRTAATIYEELNQYSVILGVAPRYAQSSDALNDVYVPARLATTEGTSSSTGSANPALRNPSTGSVLSRSEEHTSELQSLMRNSYAVFCLK